MDEERVPKLSLCVRSHFRSQRLHAAVQALSWRVCVGSVRSPGPGTAGARAMALHLADVLAALAALDLDDPQVLEATGITQADVLLGMLYEDKGEAVTAEARVSLQEHLDRLPRRRPSASPAGRRSRPTTRVLQ